MNGAVRELHNAGWRESRFPRRAVGADEVISVVPDWISEPPLADRTAQLAPYARAGVGHVWLIDERARTVDSYRLERAGWVRIGSYAGNVYMPPEPFDGADIDLGALWKR